MAEVQHGKGSFMHVSRRSFLAGTAAAAAFSIIGLPRKSAATVTPLQVLTGPVTSIGGSAYDTLQVTQAGIYAPGGSKGFPEFPNDKLGSNYYDLALSLYLLFYRTGESRWREGARTVAQTWANDPLSLATTSNIPPRSFSTLGLAVYHLDTGDAKAKTVVNAQATKASQTWGTFTGRGCDMREASYALMAMIASTIIGGDNHSAGALKSLNGLLAGQKSDGRWQNIDDCVVTGACTGMVPAGYYTLNYMMGLVMEALIMYDRAIGDSRIVPALRAGTNWLWTTQWVPTVPTSSPPFGAFQYADIDSGSVNTEPSANLSGLIVPAWGYLYAKTQLAIYATQGQTILDGMVAGNRQLGIAGAGIYNVKQFSQEFRSSPRYLGFVAGTASSSSTLQAPTGLTVR
jgi:hypothetical protein